MAARGNGDEALRYAERALSSARERTPELLRTLAVALHMTGDAGAIAAAEEAVWLLDRGEGGRNADELRRLLEADLARYQQ